MMMSLWFILLWCHPAITTCSSRSFRPSSPEDDATVTSVPGTIPLAGAVEDSASMTKLYSFLQKRYRRTTPMGRMLMGSIEGKGAIQADVGPQIERRENVVDSMLSTFFQPPDDLAQETEEAGLEADVEHSAVTDSSNNNENETDQSSPAVGANETLEPVQSNTSSEGHEPMEADDSKLQGDHSEEMTESSHSQLDSEREVNLSTEEEHSSMGHEEEHHSTGVHVSLPHLYEGIAFLMAAWMFGKVSIFLGMPSLVGEIACGFIFGPPLINIVPSPEGFVLFGEIGLILLLLEAGVEVDVAQLKVTGARSFLIATTGTLLPLAAATGVALAFGLDISGAIALGATFSPTSLGVASNALRTGKVLNTPVGQLIIAACVVDDVFGLILLSMLEVLVLPNAQIYQYFIPVISAFGYLGVLGFVGIYVIPKVMERYILPRFPKKCRDQVGFILMMLLMMAYMPLLAYSKASYLTGAFLAGLSFSQIPSMHHAFIRYTRNVMSWLLRVFFAASIGFQVPIKLFAQPSVLLMGLAVYSAVLAKFPVGLFVPKFEQKVPDNYPFNPYWRDTIVVGLAMTCRGEFSFIIASFAVSEGLIEESHYASIVFAVLLSCITSPFALLQTLKYYNRLASDFVCQIEEQGSGDGTVPLTLVVQARTQTKWGLSDILNRTLDNLGLTVIDHRSWHPRGVNAVVVSEIYIQDSQVEILLHSGQAINLSTTESSDEEDSPSSPARALDNVELGQGSGETDAVQKRIDQIQKALTLAIGQPRAVVNVVQWKPHESHADFSEVEAEEHNAMLAKKASEELRRHEEIDTGLELDHSRPPIGAKTLSTPVAINGPFKVPGPRGISTPELPTLHEVRRASAAAAIQRRRSTMVEPVIEGLDLWDNDDESTYAVAGVDGYEDAAAAVSSSIIRDFDEGRARFQRLDLDHPEIVTIEQFIPTIQERLEGLVRHHVEQYEQRLDPSRRTSAAVGRNSVASRRTSAVGRNSLPGRNSTGGRNSTHLHLHIYNNSDGTKETNPIS